jgi:HlyD family secretion protein
VNKWIGILLVVLVIIGGWWYVRENVRPIPQGKQPKYGKVERGDLSVPIMATGLIEPDLRIEVKSKASGKVQDVNVVEGSRVRVNDELVVLDPVDEQRNVDRAQAARDRAEALRDQSKLAITTAEANLERAKARVQELTSRETNLQDELERVKDIREQTLGAMTEVEERDARTNLEMASAQLRAARADEMSAANAIKDADANVRVQEANLRESEKVLEEAKLRLAETKIASQYDAIVTEVLVKPGMLVVSGTGALAGGGTILLTLADISRMKVMTRVDDADYGEVRDIAPVLSLPDIDELREAARQNAEQMAEDAGRVKITVDAFRDEVFEGRIDRVEPQGKLQAGSSVIQFDVHVDITDPKRFMLPLGSQAQVEFKVSSVVNALLIPADAVKTHEGQRGVWIKTTAKGDERFGRRFLPCRFGITDGESTQVVEVLGGERLEVGQEVYTKLPAAELEKDE